jgi:hypothetical protein
MQIFYAQIIEQFNPELNSGQSPNNNTSDRKPRISGKITHEWNYASLNNSKLAELLHVIYGDGII